MVLIFDILQMIIVISLKCSETNLCKVSKDAYDILEHNIPHHTMHMIERFTALLHNRTFCDSAFLSNHTESLACWMPGKISYEDNLHISKFIDLASHFCKRKLFLTNISISTKTPNIDGCAPFVHFIEIISQWCILASTVLQYIGFIATFSAWIVSPVRRKRCHW